MRVSTESSTLTASRMNGPLLRTSRLQPAFRSRGERIAGRDHPVGVDGDPVRMEMSKQMGARVVLDPKQLRFGRRKSGCERKVSE
jgi:hypothetical protein